VTPRVRPLDALVCGAVLVLVVLPLSFWEHLPHLCLNRHLFGFCPGCGSVRALAALFHGDLGSALRLNPNCLVTGPLLLALLAVGLHRPLGPGADAGRPRRARHDCLTGPG